MKRRNRTKSLQVLMAAFIAVIVTLVLGVLGSVDFYRTKQDKSDALKADLAAISSRLTVNLVAPLWDMNMAGARGVLESEMTNRNLYAAEVVHKDNLNP